MANSQKSSGYRASYGSNIYKSGNLYRVRVSVGGYRNDAYVTTLAEARSLRRSWKSEQASA
jgi:hypothetical protein